MTRKCYFCKTTKGLKSIWYEDDERGMINTSSCNKCFFDNELENDTEVTRDNWDYFNYNWDLKRNTLPKSLLTKAGDCNRE